MEGCDSTLFIVEDDPRSRRALGALASSLQIKYEVFASAEEFLERYESSLWGCALIDYRLGGMDGLRLQEELQAMNSMLSVVLISAHADVSMAVRAMKNGALTLIEKPYQHNELSDAVHKAMTRSEQVRRLREGLAEQRQRLESLTAQERQMVDLVLAGVPQKRATRLLKISLRTVNRLRAAVYRKMGVGSCVELARIVAALEGSVLNDVPMLADDSIRQESCLGITQNRLGWPLSNSSRDDVQHSTRFIAYDLHDGPAQYLSMALMHLQSCEQFGDAQTAIRDAAFQNAKKLLMRGHEELRSFIGGLHATSASQDIVDALQKLIADLENQLDVELVHDPKLTQLSPRLSVVIYRVVQESLANVCRHSQSRRARIQIRQEDGQLFVEIEDWGIGFDAKRIAPGRLGLTGIHERVTSLGGEARVISAPGEGTRIIVRIPVA
jgi:FixJ family two-component response regulator/two-component sensor histidine kinase